MKKIPNTFAANFDGGDYPGGKFFSIRDLAESIKWGIMTWEMIPEQYHDEVQAWMVAKRKKIEACARKQCPNSLLILTRVKEEMDKLTYAKKSLELKTKN
jgi:hypothetical protein